MEFKNLLLTRQDRVLTVTLHRPEKRNALSYDLMNELIELCAQLREDTDTRVVIFRGEGKHFTAGMDLEASAAFQATRPTLLQKRRMITIGPRMIRALHEIDQITIAAMHGGTVGGGACIVSALDFRIGAEDCFVSYPEILLGMNLSWGGLPLCVRLVGPSRAKRMVILGNRENAQTLLDWGYLDEVVSPDRLLDRAMEMASEYAARPPVQAQMIKRSVNAVSGSLDPALMHMDADQFLLASTSEDHSEGIAAFLQKRKPNFKGK